jgi:hypothetical protein
LRSAAGAVKVTSTITEVCLNLRNRLIWIAALSVAFATVQWVASRRKAEQERAAYLRDKLTPLANQCLEQARQRTPSLQGTLALQLGLVPDGKLKVIIETVAVTASSQVQAPELAECIRERAKTIDILQTLRSGPEQVELTLPL